MLQGDDFSARGLFSDQCGSDLYHCDPADTLEYHKAIKNDPTFPSGLSTFRPDKALNLDMPGFTEYIGRLEQATGFTISSVAELKEALQSRMDYFHDNGCRISDHGLEYAIYAEATDEEVENIFRLAIDGNKVTRADADRYKTKMLVFLGREYAKRSWAMQLHVGTIRNNNSRMYSILGPDTGFDAIGDSHQAVIGAF